MFWHNKRCPLAYTAKKVTVYSTVQGQWLNRWKKLVVLTFKTVKTTCRNPNVWFLSIQEKLFKHYIGIGGAITDASAEVFAKMPKAAQQELLTAYYDKK